MNASDDFFGRWCNEEVVDEVVGRATSPSRISSSLANPLVIRSRNAASSISSSSSISGKAVVSRPDVGRYVDPDEGVGVCSKEPKLSRSTGARLKDDVRVWVNFLAESGVRDMPVESRDDDERCRPGRDV